MKEISKLSQKPYWRMALDSFRAHQTQAKAAYQDFLRLWKAADPDIPVLKQAKAEYAKLH